MNYTTTVLKQTSSSSLSSSVSAASAAGARMSPNIAISTSAHFASHTVAKSATITATLNSQSVRFGSKRTSILMESNTNQTKSILNQMTPECARDKRLLELLSLVPDEPLYPHRQCNENAIEFTSSSTCKNGAVAAANGDGLVQMHPQTSDTSSFRADDFENLPPSTNTEVAAKMMDSEASPVKQINHPQMHLIQRDLNSPSANNRLRAIRALKDPTIKYYNFDVPHEEQDIITEEDRLAAIPKTIQEVLKDVVVYVEVRYGADNRTGGVKNVISRMGAKVNDRLLKNTTHVIFKDGLHSTYNKAKSWNIPIVSILWIEACRNHLCVMDPRGYPISNLDQYENPWLYGKVKRVKAINFGTEDKMMIKKPSKAKLLESLKDDVVPASPKTPTKSKPLAAPKPIAPLIATKPASAASNRSINARKSMNSSVSANKPAASSQSRKTMNGNVEPTPKNTIRSMFQKQMEKSQSASASQDSISDQLAAIDLAKVPASPKPSEKEAMLKVPASPKPSELKMAGSLHMRVTRRNSLSMPQANSDEIVKTPVPMPSSKTPARKTMYTPRVSDVMEEEKLGPSPALAPVANKTVNQTAMMDIDRTVSQKCNNTKTGQLNTIIVETPTEGINQKQWLLNSLSKRKTLYTPQPVDETSMLESRMTPLANRKSMRITMNDTPGTQDLVEKSTRPDDKTHSTPYDWSKGMPKLDEAAFGNGSASKTLIDEYTNTFSSKKIVVASNRRTLSHISMDIINQRIENLNKNASLHRSRNDSMDNRYGESATDQMASDPSPMKPTEHLNSTPDGIKPKPLKRKLFAPPSMFSPVDMPPALMTDTPPNKTGKGATKRNRDVLSPLASKSTPLSSTAAASKKMSDKRMKKCANDADNNNAITAKKATITKSTRRSTLLFQSAEKIRPKNERTVAAANTAAESLTPKSVLVFTNMHQTQIDAIKEAVDKLGKFTIENNVSEHTTHVITLENRRTINLMRGIIRGLWILSYDWIVKSLEAFEWQPEELYEMKSISKAVQICRMERQAFNNQHYKMDIFSEIGPIYVSLDCKCGALAELIKLCRGKITKHRSMAKVIIADRAPHNSTLHGNVVSSAWILDSIFNGKLLKQQLYRLANAEKQCGKENELKTAKDTRNVYKKIE